MWSGVDLSFDGCPHEAQAAFDALYGGCCEATTTPLRTWWDCWRCCRCQRTRRTRPLARRCTCWWARVPCGSRCPPRRPIAFTMRRSSQSVLLCGSHGQRIRAERHRPHLDDFWPESGRHTRDRKRRSRTEGPHGVARLLHRARHRDDLHSHLPCGGRVPEPRIQPTLSRIDALDQPVVRRRRLLVLHHHAQHDQRARDGEPAVARLERHRSGHPAGQVIPANGTVFYNARDVMSYPFPTPCVNAAGRSRLRTPPRLRRLSSSQTTLASSTWLSFDTLVFQRRAW
jgi:hypothetical protein